jgi:hypothetical protein
LDVTASRSADRGRFIGGQAHPIKHLEQAALAVGVKAGAVGVFDSQNKLAAVLVSKDAVKQGLVNRANVWVASWGRGNAGFYRHRLWILP